MTEYGSIELLTTGIDGAVEFETAVEETGYGLFNVMLIMVAIPAGWSSIFETTTMSFVFPAAQCDLDLTLNSKGLLNAITYSGMISSALFWGFLADAFGRRKLLVIGLLLDGMFVLLSSFSQSITLLMISKFMGGFIINGPFAALTAYLSEFHAAKYRARVQMSLGIIFSFGNVLLPLLAWGILPRDWDISVFYWLNLHSWNFYLLMCSLPALTSGILFMFLPESPKFLMTAGRNKEALEVFKKVYHINTGRPKDTFPVKELADEIKVKREKEVSLTGKRTKKEMVKEGWYQTKRLVFPPFLSKILLVCLIQFLFVLSLNTLRLWVPQIFQAINDYQHLNNGTTASLCSMLEVIKPSAEVTECSVNMDNASVYQNAMIIGATQILAYIVAGSLINAVGKKRILFTLSILAGCSCISIYFSNDEAVTLALFSIFVAFGGICVNVLLSVIVDLFPTTLRTMSISLSMMIGRTGAMTGNLVFPLLLQTGCAPPFSTIAASITTCGLLTLLLPNTDLKALV